MPEKGGIGGFFKAGGGGGGGGSLSSWEAMVASGESQLMGFKTHTFSQGVPGVLMANHLWRCPVSSLTFRYLLPCDAQRGSYILKGERKHAVNHTRAH